ncbi:MAG: hypothetical protein KIT87_10110 [Anaerolineae bacterium]|nr:hypothetical protein [Anaerolineae bacterium]
MKELFTALLREPGAWDDLAEILRMLRQAGQEREANQWLAEAIREAPDLKARFILWMREEISAQWPMEQAQYYEAALTQLFPLPTAINDWDLSPQDARAAIMADLARCLLAETPNPHEMRFHLQRLALHRYLREGDSMGLSQLRELLPLEPAIEKSLRELQATMRAPLAGLAELLDSSET